MPVLCIRFVIGRQSGGLSWASVRPKAGNSRKYSESVMSVACGRWSQVVSISEAAEEKNKSAKDADSRRESPAALICRLDIYPTLSAENA